MTERWPKVRRALLCGLPVLLLAWASAHALAPLCLAVLLAGWAMVGAHRAPQLAVAVAVVVTAAVPIYWFPTMRGPLEITPALGSCLLLVPASLTRLRTWRLQTLDLAVVALVLGVAVSGYAQTGRLSSPSVLALGIVLPFGVFRLLGLQSRVRDVTAAALLMVAVPLSVLGLVEHATGSNPFFGVVTGGYEGAVWAHAESRFGTTRAEASFGHPIAFGVFLAVVVVMAVTRSQAASRRLLPVLCAVGVLAAAALVATLSRGPLVAAAMAAVVVVLVGVRGSTAGTRLRTGAIVGLLVGVLAAVPTVRASVSQLQTSTVNASSDEAKTFQHRTDLLRALIDPTQFSLLGRSGGPLDGQSETSVDSEYVVVYETAGAFSVVPLILCAILCAAGLLRVRRTRDRAWPAACLTMLLGAVSVALITQTFPLLFALLGLASAAIQRAREGDTAQAAPVSAVIGPPPTAAGMRR